MNMFNLSGYAYDGTSFQKGGIYTIHTDGTWSGSSRATRHDWYTTPSGSTTLTLQMVLFPSGGLAVGTSTTDPGAGGLALHPGASVTPTSNGDLVIQATSNTSLTFKYKGSDGTVRSGSITLA